MFLIADLLNDSLEIHSKSSSICSCFFVGIYYPLIWWIIISCCQTIQNICVKLELIFLLNFQTIDLGQFSGFYRYLICSSMFVFIANFRQKLYKKYILGMMFHVIPIQTVDIFFESVTRQVYYEMACTILYTLFRRFPAISSKRKHNTVRKSEMSFQKHLLLSQ